MAVKTAAVANRQALTRFRSGQELESILRKLMAPNRYPPFHPLYHIVVMDLGGCSALVYSTAFAYTLTGKALIESAAKFSHLVAQDEDGEGGL